jgi:hypothetical protein
VQRASEQLDRQVEIVKALNQNRREMRWPLFATALLLAAVPIGLLAGEPIQFTNGKALPKARQGSKLTRDIESGSDQGTSVKGFEIVLPSYSASSLDPKEEKRRKEAALERKNWMILDQGELKEAREEDESFGIRESSIEREKDAGDYWFSPKGDDANRGPGSGRGSGMTARVPGQSRGMPPGANRGQRAPPASKEPEANRSALSGSTGQGAHIANELNLRTLFSPNRSGSAPMEDKSALSLKDIFGASPAGDNLRGDRSPMKGLGSSQSHSSMGFDSRLDVKPPAALPAFAPTSPGLFDNSPRSPAGGSAFDQTAGSSAFRSGGAFNSAAGNDSLSSRGSTFGGGLTTPQGQSGQRPLTSRDYFDRPKMPGQ